MVVKAYHVLHLTTKTTDMENINMNTKKPCGFWPLGECKRGDRCDREHHANLNPALVGHKAVPGYNVPNETGEACLRCMSRIYPVCSPLMKSSLQGS